MNLTISGFSTALFSTWYFIEELGLLFDAGDGVSAQLLSKSRKINHVFISHPDRDHLTGLLQLNQLNAREGFPIIYYPKDSSSFPYLKSFTQQFDPHVKGTIWEPITENEEFEIKKNISVHSIRNGHVSCDSSITKSLSFKVIETKEKLRDEFLSKKGPEIKKLIEEKGKSAVMRKENTTLLGYSGDTPVEDLERWQDTKILIHEATFLEDENQREIKAHGNLHSYLEEVMEMVAHLRIEKLILGHFSSRYNQEQIDRSILQLCDKHSISIPIHRLLPGQTTKNILSYTPINA